MKTPYPYQIKQVDGVSLELGSGKKSVVAQLPTGGGKTVEFAYMCNRYLQATDKNILILVHREELLNQARETLHDWYQINSETVVAGKKMVTASRVYIAMVETAERRLKKSERYFPNIGLVIIDECHIGNFTKVLPYFPEAFIVGYTATPKTASKLHPLKEIYQSIVAGPQIRELIESGALLPNITYRTESVSRAQLKANGRTGDFDIAQMDDLYSKAKHVKNTIEGYEKHCRGKKTIIFNCSVHHSELVNGAFLEAGYPSRHLDGDSAGREEIIEWFRTTPGAIVNNIGVLTTGFDEPTIEAVIINKATLSLPLWLQMCGRGSRICPAIGKTHFVIIDMGDNIKTHSDWSVDRDWSDMFYNPAKPTEGGGLAPIMECESCEAYIPASSRVCPFCGHEIAPKIPAYDAKLVEFILVTNNIDVTRVILQNGSRNPYAGLHKIKETIVRDAKNKLQTLDDDSAYKLLEAYQVKVSEWCRATGKNYNDFHKGMTGEWFLEELAKIFGWTPPALSIAI